MAEAYVLKPLRTAQETLIGLMQQKKQLEQHGKSLLEMLKLTLNMIPNHEAKIGFLELLLEGQMSFESEAIAAEKIFNADILILTQAGHKIDPENPPRQSPKYREVAKELLELIPTTGFDIEAYEALLANNRKELENLLEEVKKDQ